MMKRLILLLLLSALTPVSVGTQTCDGALTWTGTVPDCLSSDDKYRIPFISNTDRNAVSSDIEEYDAGIRDHAIAPSRAAFADAGISNNFKVLASTRNEEARDNINTIDIADMTYRLAQAMPQLEPVGTISSASVEITEAEVNAGGGLTTGGTLTSSGNIGTFISQASVMVNHGSFSLTPDGRWSYTVTSAAVDFLAMDERFTESFPVSTTRGASGTVTIITVGANDPPVAVASDDGLFVAVPFTPRVGNTITVAFFGRMSSDPDTGDEDGLTYQWRQASGLPVGNIQGAQSARVTFHPPTRPFTTVVFELTVTDPQGAMDTDTVSVFVTAVSVNDITGVVGGSIIEDSVPNSVTGRLLGPNESGIGFHPQEEVVGTYGVFRLGSQGAWTYMLDNDIDATNALPGSGSLMSANDFFQAQERLFAANGSTVQVNISVQGVNDPPTVDVEPVPPVTEGDTVTLIGVASDPDIDSNTGEREVVTYLWTQTPVRTVDLTGAQTARASFMAPEMIEDTVVLTFTLTVRDPSGATGTDMVSVTVQLPPAAAMLSGTLTEANLFASPAPPVTVTLVNTEYEAAPGTLMPSHFSVTDTVAGTVSVIDVTRNSDTEATLTLAYSGEDITADGTLTVILAAAGHTGNDDLITNTILITASAGVNICGRTPQVRDAIVAVSTAPECTSITDLETITAIDLSGRSIMALLSGDFDGLAGLTTLNLRNNPFMVDTGLPAGTFDDVVDTLGAIDTDFLVDQAVRDAHFVCSRSDADAIVAATTGVTDCLRITTAQLATAIRLIDATLSGLTLSGGTLNPAFASDILAYTVTVPNSVRNVLVRPTATESSATVIVNTNLVDRGTLVSIPLDPGVAAVIVIEVTAADEATAQTYTVTVTRAPPPTIMEIVLTSDAVDDVYSIGETIEAAVIFSEAVTVTGTPELTLMVGDQMRPALYSGSGSGSAATIQVFFSYTVIAGDSDDNGVSIGANALTVPDGSTIRDAADTTDALVSHTVVVPDDSNHRVDGVAPMITGLALTAGPYTIGDAIELTATFNEVVVVDTIAGTPLITLTLGRDPARHSSPAVATRRIWYSVVQWWPVTMMTMGSRWR